MKLPNHLSFHVISGFRHDVDEICALLRYYAVSSGNPFTDVSEQRVGAILTIEHGTDTFSQNVGKGLPFDAV
jgi:hypothetical protein